MTVAGGEPAGALVVARNPSNRELLGGLLSEAGLTVEALDSLEAAEASVAKIGPPVLALVDIDGFSPEVWRLCAVLVEAEASVIVIASSRTDEVQEATLGLGVRSVLEKPLHKANLMAMVRTLTGADAA